MRPRSCRRMTLVSVRRLANEASRVMGSVAAFGAALGIVIVWGVTGPLFDYSDTWQLVINTGNDHRDVSDGLPDSEYPEPGQCGDPIEIG